MVITRVDGRPLPALDLTVTWHRAGWIWVPAALILAGGLVTALPRLVRLVRARLQPAALQTREPVDA